MWRTPKPETNCKLEQFQNKAKYTEHEAMKQILAHKKLKYSYKSVKRFMNYS